jgi:hypothetical protein
MSTWPKMMYLHDGSMNYKVASSAIEAKELEELGYDYTGWPEKKAQALKPVKKVEPAPIVKEKEVPTGVKVLNKLVEEPKEPEVVKEVKKYPFGRCPVCKKSMKNFDHTECGT